MNDFCESMSFTYDSYINMLYKLKSSGFSLIPFYEAKSTEGPKAILRHDVDISPRKAEFIAEIENLIGVSSTYFVMISSSWYNLFDKKNEESIRHIIDLGHEVGLHFDVSKYGKIDEKKLIDTVQKEVDTLSNMLGIKVKSISWHIPDRSLLGKKFEYFENQGYVNAYDAEFFENYKYLSDSSMRWRENPEKYFDTQKNPNLQILTHPVWYTYMPCNNGDSILFSIKDEKEFECIDYLESILPGFKERNFR